MSSPIIVTLRVILVLLFLVAMGAQGLIVGGIATQFEPGDERMLGAIYGSGAILALVGIEVALLAVWVLLGMVRRDVIFDGRAFRWVGVLTAAGPVATLPIAAICLHYGQLDDAPGLGGIGLGIGLAGAAFALLMLVMKGLLRKATMLRTELAGVV